VYVGYVDRVEALQNVVPPAHPVPLLSLGLRFTSPLQACHAWCGAPWCARWRSFGTPRRRPRHPSRRQWRCTRCRLRTWPPRTPGYNPGFMGSSRTQFANGARTVCCGLQSPFPQPFLPFLSWDMDIPLPLMSSFSPIPPPAPGLPSLPGVHSALDDPLPPSETPTAGPATPRSPCRSLRRRHRGQRRAGSRRRRRAGTGTGTGAGAAVAVAGGAAGVKPGRLGPAGCPGVPTKGAFSWMGVPRRTPHGHPRVLRGWLGGSRSSSGRHAPKRVPLPPLAPSQEREGLQQWQWQGRVEGQGGTGQGPSKGGDRRRGRAGVGAGGAAGEWGAGPLGLPGALQSFSTRAARASWGCTTTGPGPPCSDLGL